jgi:hypothetical protein
MNISVLTKSFGGEMDKREIEKRLLDHVDPNRRSFVRQILGGAALVAPLVATFSIESLIAPEEARAANSCSVKDTGYAGPALYQVHFKDPSHTTTAKGTATFQIMGNPPGTFSVKTAQVYYSIVLSPPAVFESGLAFIASHGEVVADLNEINGVIDQSCLKYICDMEEFLDALDSEYSTIFVFVDVQGTRYSLTGTIKSVPPTIITLGP